MRSNPLVMAAPVDTQGNEREKLEDEFQQTVRSMGGKERIHLVGEICKTDGDQRISFLTLTDELFNHNSTHCSNSVIVTLNDNTRPGAKKLNNSTNDVTDMRDVLPKTEDKCMNAPSTDGQGLCHGDFDRVIRSSRNASGTGRLIDSAMLIFIFRHEYISNNCNHVCIKEIIKDMKARTKRSPTFPAVIGLVHSTHENRESLQSVQILERLLRSVFRKHCSDSIWAGLFIPNTEEKMMDIKRHINKAVHSSLSSG